MCKQGPKVTRDLRRTEQQFAMDRRLFDSQQVNMQTRPPIHRAVRFSELSSPRQKLVRFCQEINYGSIRGLQVQEREPVFEPPPIFLTDVKLDGDYVPRPEIDLSDFALRDEVVRLMANLDWLVDTTIECLEVHAGIPRRAHFILSPMNTGKHQHRF